MAKQYILLVALLLPLAAHAEDKHAIDLTMPVLDQNGQPFKDVTAATPADKDCAHCGPLTLGKVLATALLTPRPEDKTKSAIDLAKQGALGLKIAEDKSIVLSAAEITKIEPLLNVWAPLIVARTLMVIDPAALNQ